jgi:hypothetical protein
LNVAIYRHPIEAIESFQGSEQDLYRELCQGTRYGVVIPLSMMMSMYDTIISPYTYRYDGKGNGNSKEFDHCTCINHTPLNMLLESPEKLLPLFGHPVDSFTVRRVRTPRSFFANAKNLGKTVQ